mgnify:CR=1 FL=1
MSMEMQIFKKGALYSVDCSKCGSTNFTHEWFHMDHNERRDAMQAGTLACDDCFSLVDPETFTDRGRHYAGWYSMPGYLDHTEPLYDKNLHHLKRDLCKN